MLKWETEKAVHGENAANDWMCQKWFAMFVFFPADFSLNHVPGSGIPVEVNSNQDITWE